MNNIQELREVVNPVFNTAKACLEFDANNGDPDSRLLLNTLGFESMMEQNAKQTVPPEMLAVARRLTPVFSSYVESRFHCVNRLLSSRPDRTIIDLPCGYTARGIKMSHMGRNYYGFDLPAVIDIIAPAVAKISDGDEAIHYAAVDATNYETMEAPLSGTAASLLITTEGLLMYLTQPELEEVFSNVRRLLQKHGGSWVLVDRTYYLNEQRIADVILHGDMQAMGMFKAVSAKGAGTMADIKTYNNVFFRSQGIYPKDGLRAPGDLHGGLSAGPPCFSRVPAAGGSGCARSISDHVFLGTDGQRREDRKDKRKSAFCD